MMLFNVVKDGLWGLPIMISYLEQFDYILPMTRFEPYTLVLEATALSTVSQPMANSLFMLPKY